LNLVGLQLVVLFIASSFEDFKELSIGVVLEHEGLSHWEPPGQTGVLVSKHLPDLGFIPKQKDSDVVGCRVLDLFNEDIKNLEVKIVSPESLV
jgi:hypothetical protein